MEQPIKVMTLKEIGLVGVPKLASQKIEGVLTRKD